MATSSFTRKIIITGKEATDAIIDALTSDDKKENLENNKSFLDENNKRGRLSLEKFASLCKK